jgi:hypothetical protein
VTDDTAAIQAAINASSEGGALYIPVGAYKYTALSVNKSISIVGQNPRGTALRCSSTTSDGLTFTTTNSVQISNLTMDTSVTKTSGSYIRINPASGYNGNSLIQLVTFSNAYEAIRIDKGSSYTIQDCEFNQHKAVGVVVANTDVPDAGDSTITGCLFNSTVSGSIHISQQSSGGLRINNNKFLHADYHYLGQFNSYPNNTSILLFENNSSEAANVANIAFSSSSSTTFEQVIISGNQISLANSATAILFTDPGYNWISGILISNNTFNLSNSSTGISIARALSSAIGVNIFLGNGTSTSGISFGSNAYVTVSPQIFNSVTTEYLGSFTNINFNPPSIQSGFVSGTSSTVYGSLYITSSITVTFAKAFPKAPAVNIDVLATGGGISAITSTPTTTGFSINLVGVTNGGAVQANWSALG